MTDEPDWAPGRQTVQVVPTAGDGDGSAPFTEALLDVVEALDSSSLPPLAVERTTACVLDAAGCALAGWDAEAGQLGAGHALTAFAESSSTVLGSPVQIAPAGAAFANGVLTHALDLDDTSWAYIGHPGTVILPAALAIAEERHMAGRDLVAAFVAGLEVAARVGRSQTDAFGRRGWHLTTTIGVFGAASAAGKLLALDRRQLAHALGLAASQAAGLKANFGSMAKPFQAGFAARNGLEAALLAESGVTACTSAFDHRFGFYGVLAGGEAPRAEPFSVDDLSLLTDGVAFKRYPCCTGSHPAIDAVLALAAEHGLVATGVESIRCGTTAEVLDELLHPVPETPEEARFSMSFPVAIALSQGRLGAEHFSERFLEDDLVRSLMERCETFVDADLERPPGVLAPAALVEIRYRDGRAYRQRVDSAKGNPGNPLTPDELAAKFDENARRRIRDAGQVAALREAIEHLEQLDDVGELLALARTEPV